MAIIASPLNSAPILGPTFSIDKIKSSSFFGIKLG